MLFGLVCQNVFGTDCINHIPTGLDSTIRLFADDTIAYLVIKSNSGALKTCKEILIN